MDSDLITPSRSSPESEALDQVVPAANSPSSTNATNAVVSGNSSYSSQLPPLSPRRLSRAVVVSAIAVVAILGIGSSLVFMLAGSHSPKLPSYKPTTSTLPSNSSGKLQLQDVLVNGQLYVNNGLVIAPTVEPGNPTVGQLYLSSVTKQLSYYNGSQFIALGSSTNTNLQGGSTTLQGAAAGSKGIQGPAGPTGPTGASGGTSTSASTLVSGTLSDNRLSPNVALLNRDSQTFHGRRQTFQNTSNDTTAFSIQAADGTPELTVDTVNNTVTTTDLLPRVATRINNGFNTNALFTTVSTSYNDNSSFSALGIDGFVQFVYFDNSYHDIHLVHCTNAACTTLTNIMVASYVNQVDEPSIVVGKDGFARVAYINYNSPNELHFIRCTNADCSTKVDTLIYNPANAGLYNTSVELGSDGFARIVFDDYGQSPKVLNLARCLNDDCTSKNVTVVSTSTSGTENNAQAFGQDGFLRIAYLDNNNFTVHFIQCPNADCTTPTNTLIDTLTNAFYVSLAIAHDGFARIAYAQNGPLKYVQCTNAACTTNINTTLDASTNFEPSLAIGTNGMARISYDSGAPGLNFIDCINDACSGAVPVTIDSINPYPQSMVLGNDGFARIVYGAPGNSIKFAQLNTDTGQPVNIGGSNIGSNSARFGTLYNNSVNTYVLALSGSATFPINPTEGEVIYDSNSKQLLVYSNSQWQADKKSTATEIVAASNSLNKYSANYIATGTNDQNIINAAIAALPSTGGSVVLLDGTYNIGGDINISQGNVTLTGQGKSTILNRNFSGAPIINISTSSDNIYDLAIAGNKSTYSNIINSGIYLNSFAGGGLRISNVNIDSTAGNSIDVGNGGANIPNYITNNTITNSGKDGITCLTTGSLVSGNSVSNSSSVGIFADCGVHITISNNYISFSGDIGIWMNGNDEIASNNTVINGNSAGIDVDQSGTTIIGNNISSNNIGVDIDGRFDPANNTISDNHITSNNTDGISINSSLSGASANNVVTGNYIANNGGSGIDINGICPSVGANNNLISSNQISNNGGSNGYSSITITGSNAVGNQFTGNQITDSAGTGYAIYLGAGTTNSYLSNNIYSGTGASSINNLGTNSIYADQMNSNGSIVLSNANGTVIQGTISQGNDLLDIQNSSGTLLAHISPTGFLTLDAAKVEIRNNNPAGYSTIRTTGTETLEIQGSQGGATGELVLGNSTGGITALGLLQANAGIVVHTTLSTSIYGYDGINGTTWGISGLGYAQFGIGAANNTSTTVLTLYPRHGSDIGEIIQSASGQTADLLDLLNSSSAIIAKIDSSGNLSVQAANVNSTLTVGGHIISGGGTPTYTSHSNRAGGAACDNAPSITIVGTDTAGLLSIMTPNTGTCGIGALVSVIFTNSFSNNAPNITLTPAGATATSIQYYVDQGSTNGNSFRVSSNSTVAMNTIYKYYYHVFQ